MKRGRRGSPAWHAAVGVLRRATPLPFPVRVIRSRTEGCLGLCELRGKGKHRRFLIRVDPDLPLSIALHILVHEWAHALDAWGAGVVRHEWTPADHGDTWGLHYARVYRALFE